MWIQIPRNYHSMIINNISIAVATWQHTKPQKRTKHAKHNGKPISKGKIGSYCKRDPSIQVHFPANERINIHFNLPKRWSHRAPESPANTNKIMKQNPLSLLSHTKREEKSTEKLNGRNVALEIDNGRRKAIYMLSYLQHKEKHRWKKSDIYCHIYNTKRNTDGKQCIYCFSWFWKSLRLRQTSKIWMILKTWVDGKNASLSQSEKRCGNK